MNPEKASQLQTIARRLPAVVEELIQACAEGDATLVGLAVGQLNSVLEPFNVAWLGQEQTPRLAASANNNNLNPGNSRKGLLVTSQQTALEVKARASDLQKALGVLIEACSPASPAANYASAVDSVNAANRRLASAIEARSAATGQRITQLSADGGKTSMTAERRAQLIDAAGFSQ